ncbi:LysR family transcriptional regulator [Undibacterium parvum]|uniref:LysR family transcriptional regulator n=2 Tax=Undibacterium TaxID=401469 RepID=A0A6M4A2R6_9BURK|nr:LysR family transcriptional regulator [Undibacterium parvum]AZP10898.1 LysR family transcriptional regulator [Undibacterium parvum]QJQ05474.1 LysR family transcriptional regulator [Undibacterium piscinae]
MISKTQYKLSAADLELVLALNRGGTLAAAGERLALDASTVFRSIQRIERGLGQQLFARSRNGYLALELAQVLTAHAEQLERELESARSAAQLVPDQVSGTVRLSTTDTILHGLVAGVLPSLRVAHPLLELEMHTGNELANLTRRDADIALRATKKPPQHLVGKRIGPIRIALFASAKSGIQNLDDVRAQNSAWIAPDDALPEHPSVLWRKKYFPKVQPQYRVSSILTVAEFVAQGVGVGIVPLFLGQHRSELRQITDALDENQTELWLLTHTESRHLRRVSTVFAHLANQLILN